MIPFPFFPVNPFKNTKEEITFYSKTEHRNITFFAYRIACIEKLMRMTDKKGLEQYEKKLCSSYAWTCTDGIFDQRVRK